MEAKELKIVDVLTENKKYIIPPYQRPYSWDDEHAVQLIKDIHESFESEAKEYFIGSLICINKGADTYEVVDGQQRLTTLSLIVAKIRDMTQDADVRNELQKRILPSNAFRNKVPQPRLKIRSKEEDFYVNFILKGIKESKSRQPSFTESLFINNFQKIEDYLNENLLKDKMADFAEYVLHNVFIIFVQTDNFTSSYRLFNVLNTRGLSLKQSDLVKNHFLEVAAKDGIDASEKIEQYWDEIEDIIGVERMDSFLRFYEISRKNNRKQGILKDRLGELIVKRLKDEFKNDAPAFAIKLKEAAIDFNNIKSCQFTNKEVTRVVYLLIENLPDEELIPPILSYLNKYGEDKNFLEYIVLFEKCYMHRWFSGKSKTYREVFSYDTVANVNTKSNFSEIKEGLIRNANNEFLSYLDTDVCVPYSKKIQLLKYVLLKIDQEMQDGSVSKKYNELVTIEHILPQKMKDHYWTSRFSSYEHEVWVHKLGNLTLISGQKNSAASNSSFDKKRTVYEGQGKKVSFDIAKDVFQYKEWNLDNLKKRHQFLLDKAKEIWFVDKKKQLSI